MPIPLTISNIIKQSKDGVLNLEGLGLNDEHIPDIVALIVDIKPAINYLDISRNNIGFKSVEILASLSLANLNISYNNLRDKGVIELLDTKHALCQTLIWLNISENDLTDAVAKPILENSKLVYLNLGYNPDMNDTVESNIYDHIKKNSVKWEQDKAKHEQALLDERKDPTSCAQEAKTASYLIQSNTNPLTTTGTFKLPADETKESKESPSIHLKKTNRPGG